MNILVSRILFLVSCFLFFVPCFCFSASPDDDFADVIKENEPYYISASNTKVVLNDMGRVLYLNGDVRITHGTVTLTSGYGTAFESQGRIVLSDNVRIEDRGTILTGDNAIYLKKEKTAIMDGNVKIVDKKTTITADRVMYYRTERKAVLFDTVTVVDPSHILTADSITYFQREKKTIAKGNVLLVDAKNSNRTVKSEKLTYFHSTKKANAEGKVVVVDKENQAVITGDYAIYDGIVEITKVIINPRLVLKEKNKNQDTITIKDTTIVKDTIKVAKADTGFYSGKIDTTNLEDYTIITADTLAYSYKGDVANAIDNVVIKQKDISAYCEYSTLLRKKERAILTGNPVAYQKDNEIKGDTMEIFYNNNKVERVVVSKNAIGYYFSSDSSKGVEPNKVTGDKITMFVTSSADGKSEVSQIEISGKAESIYYPSEKESKSVGKNIANGDKIIVYLNKGKFERVKVVGTAKGIYRFSQSKKD